MITIDKDIPLPPDDNRGRKMKYPFPLMEVGDSILLGTCRRSSASSIAHRYAAKTDKKFTMRTVTPDSIRIWRVK